MTIDTENCADANPILLRPARTAAPLGFVAAPFRRLAQWMRQRLEARAERRYLRSLSDHMLSDLGVSRREAEGWRRFDRFGGL